MGVALCTLLITQSTLPMKVDRQTEATEPLKRRFSYTSLLIQNAINRMPDGLKKRALLYRPPSARYIYDSNTDKAHVIKNNKKERS